MQNSIMRARRIYMRGALVLVLAAIPVFMLAAPGTSHAAAPNPGFLRTVADKSSGTFLTSTLPSDFLVGDCVALTGSRLRLQRFSDSSVTLLWSQRSYTNRTKHADIWHVTFRFLNNAGQVVYTTSTLDGVPMSQIQKVYDWTLFSPDRAMSAFTYSSITQVQWEGYC